MLKSYIKFESSHQRSVWSFYLRLTVRRTPNNQIDFKEVSKELETIYGTPMCLSFLNQKEVSTEKFEGLFRLVSEDGKIDFIVFRHKALSWMVYYPKISYVYVDADGLELLINDL